MSIAGGNDYDNSINIGGAGGGIGLVKKTFFNHVFSTSEESKAEFFNVMQYSGIALIPIIALNKIVQRFIPDADPDKSSLEILFEIVVQLVILFVGIILVHRTVTYIPTYSGFKYDSLSLTSNVLIFLIIVLSIQTKLGIKVSILFERLADLWNGTDSRYRGDEEGGDGSKVRVKQPLSRKFNGSQADFLDNPRMQNDLFPPADSVILGGGGGGGGGVGGGGGAAVSRGGAAGTGAAAAKQASFMSFEPVAANSLIGSNFGSLF